MIEVSDLFWKDLRVEHDTLSGWRSYEDTNMDPIKRLSNNQRYSEMELRGPRVTSSPSPDVLKHARSPRIKDFTENI